MSDGKRCGEKLAPPMAPPTPLERETGGRMIGGEMCDVGVTSPRGAELEGEAAPSVRRLRGGRERRREGGGEHGEGGWQCEVPPTPAG